MTVKKVDLKVYADKAYGDYGEDLKIGTDFSAGVDIRSNVSGIIRKGEIFSMEPGIHLEIPEGYFGLILPRSSVGLSGVKVLNTASVIDSDYRGPVHIKLTNVLDEPFEVSAGDRLVQLILVPYVKPVIHYLDDKYELSSTERGEGGRGSTGKK